MATITKTTPVDEHHQVVTVRNHDDKFMKKPCKDCPWKKSSVGVFPAEAFRVSAHTSYDMDPHSFGCHSTSVQNPKTCAGFLLNGAQHNLGVRMRLITGDYDLSQVSDGGHALFENYKAMAIANGVSPDDDCLKLSRTD